MFVAPKSVKSSSLIMEKVRIAGVEVEALIDTRATASCCRWGWYCQHRSHFGPLTQTNMCVVGVGNSPIGVRAVTKDLSLDWNGDRGKCKMLVISTLQDYDVILGLDIPHPLKTQIDTGEGWAYPARVPRPVFKTCHQGEFRIPAGESKVFFLKSETTGLALFEPGLELSEGVRGVPTLSVGLAVAMKLDNFTKEEVCLQPGWSIE